MIKRVLCVLCCVLLTVSVTAGCSHEAKMIDFIYPFSADVNSYDPQVAATADEFLIIENTFEGLIRIDDDGTVKKGCAESWDISNDGLVYTFHLKKGLKWNITTDKIKEGEHKGEYKDKRLQFLGYEFNPDITAKDFVFALQRAAMPLTAAPMFPSVSRIQNAVNINLGKADASTLGAVAKDDYTLQITLTTPDDAFMQTLASSIAMPCNEEFFNATKGRYGLGTDYTLFNGQFYVDQILKESYLLKKNEQYTGDAPAIAGELTLKIKSESDEKDAKKNVTARLESGYYDAAFITGAQSEVLGTEAGITYVPYQDTTWVMLFNADNEILQSKLMRGGFCAGLTRLDAPEKKYLSDYGSVIPPSCSLDGVPITELINAHSRHQDIQRSKALWTKGLTIIEKDSIELTVLTTPEMENTLKAMLQGIQSGISTIGKNEDGDTVEYSIKVEAMELKELEAQLKKHEYDIALFPYKSVSTSPITFLKTFSEHNRTGFDSRKFDRLIKLAEEAERSEDKIKYIKRAEADLIGSYTVFPMLCETSYYAAAKGVSGIQFHAGSGRVSFVNATRK